MLRDITLGQYYQTESVIHRLDPRVKLIATIVFIISLFLVDSFPGYLIAGLFLGLRHKAVPCALQIHGKRHEGDSVSSYFYCDFQPLSSRRAVPSCPSGV